MSRSFSPLRVSVPGSTLDQYRTLGRQRFGTKSTMAGTFVVCMIHVYFYISSESGIRPVPYIVKALSRRKLCWGLSLRSMFCLNVVGYNR